jgi:site-specific recombinase XerD
MVDWQELAGDWLAAKGARSQSAHTQKAYRAAMARWQHYLAGLEPSVALWDVDASHVRGWQAEMRSRGLSEATINHQLSCVSSFYSWVLSETRLRQGVEVHLWSDVAGRPRTNPFRAHTAPRGRSRSYERARVLSVGEVTRLLQWLEGEAGSVAGARNLALIMSYLYTGFRSAELLRMRWGDLRASRSQPGVTIYAWRGKGGKRADDVLPAPCVAAIHAYLRADGRLGEGFAPAGDEPVWLPAATPSMEQLRHAPGPREGRPLSERSALRVLRQALRGAGIARADSFRIHDLRHTHAHLLLESGHNMATVQQRLHHSSLATTGLYVRAVHGQEPQDVVTDAFAQLRLRAESAPVSAH